jgi:hypothetical protein
MIEAAAVGLLVYVVRSIAVGHARAVIDILEVTQVTSLRAEDLLDQDFSVAVPSTKLWRVRLEPLERRHLVDLLGEPLEDVSLRDHGIDPRIPR